MEVLEGVRFLGCKMQNEKQKRTGKTQVYHHIMCFRFLASQNRLSFLYVGIRLVGILVLVFLFVQNAVAKA